MRSVPHRVVCLLGLDDGAFPRVSERDGDDLILADPYVGDRDPRSEDRQLLLDALLAATEHLVITYTGRDERTNLERPPAVPVGELLDVVDRTVRTEDGTPARDRHRRAPPAPALRRPQLHGRRARRRASVELRSCQPRRSAGVGGSPPGAAPLPPRAAPRHRHRRRRARRPRPVPAPSGPGLPPRAARDPADRRAQRHRRRPARRARCPGALGDRGAAVGGPHGRRRPRRLRGRRTGPRTAAPGSVGRADPRPGDRRRRGHRRPPPSTTPSRPRWT